MEQVFKVMICQLKTALHTLVWALLGGLSPASLALLQQQQQQNQQQQHSLYKTELCRSWEETGSCRYGAKCQVRSPSPFLCFFIS